MAQPIDIKHLVPVFNAIREAGGHTYLVGGAVRSILFGEPPRDLDFEVYNLDTKTLAHILRQFGNVDTVGKAFGVLILYMPKHDVYEFSLPRRENKVGKGHKGFTVNPDPNITIYEASSRRDFTINSMLIDMDNWNIIDPFGGREDMARRILRATTKAYKEDALRVLRGFQFIARYHLTYTDKTVAYSNEMIDEASLLSKERLWGEWSKWALLGKEYGKSIDFLFDTGWAKLYPEIYNLRDVEQDRVWHPEGDVLTHTKEVLDNVAYLCEKQNIEGRERIALIFAALLHDSGKPETIEVNENGRIVNPKHELVAKEKVDSFLDRINGPKEVKRLVHALVREHMFLRGRNSEDMISKRAVRRLSVRVAPATISLLAILMQADRMGRNKNTDAVVSRLLEVAKEIEVENAMPEPIIKGRHLINLGLTPGPLFKIILNKAYEEQLDGKFYTGEEAQAWLDDNWTSFIPNPGSDEAIKLGCTCPVIDNNYGKGYMGLSDIFVYVTGCPIHPLKLGK